MTRIVKIHPIDQFVHVFFLLLDQSNLNKSNAQKFVATSQIWPIQIGHYLVADFKITCITLV